MWSMLLTFCVCTASTIVYRPCTDTMYVVGVGGDVGDCLLITNDYIAEWNPAIPPTNEYPTNANADADAVPLPCHHSKVPRKPLEHAIYYQFRETWNRHVLTRGLSGFMSSIGTSTVSRILIYIVYRLGILLLTCLALLLGTLSETLNNFQDI